MIVMVTEYPAGDWEQAKSGSKKALVHILCGLPGFPGWLANESERI
jgi:hypothetical protein